jgi:DNA-binding SARP family transcriptional activator
MASPRIELLGGFGFRLPSGADVAMPTRRSRVLLAYLFLAGGPRPRARPMALLWGDRAEPQARGSLRQELHALRQRIAVADPACDPRSIDPCA